MAKVGGAALNGSEKLCLLLLAIAFVGWVWPRSKTQTRTVSQQTSQWQVVVTGTVAQAPGQRLLVHCDVPLDRLVVSDDSGRFEIRESLRSRRAPSTCQVSLVPPQGAPTPIARGDFQVKGEECRCDLGQLVVPSRRPANPVNSRADQPAPRTPQPLNLQLDEQTLNTLRSEPGTSR